MLITHWKVLYVYLPMTVIELIGTFLLQSNSKSDGVFSTHKEACKRVGVFRYLP